MTRRAIISVYRKEGIVELARGLGARGFEIVSTGGTAQELAKAGVQGHRHLRRDRLPRDPRRPGEDAAPADPRRHPRPPRPARAPGGARRARHPPDRPGGGQPLPVRGDGGEAARTLRGGDREHRHRRARAWCARRPRTSSTSPSSSTPPTTPLLARAARPRRRASDAATRLYLAQKAFRHTAALRRGHRRLLRAGRGEGDPSRAETRDVFPYRLDAVLREGAGPALRREPAPAGRVLQRAGSTAALRRRRANSCTARNSRYNNILDLDAALHLAREFAGPAVRHRQAQQPVRRRRRRRPRRRLHARLGRRPASAFGGILAFNRAVDGDDRRAPWPSRFVECVIAPGFDAGRARGAPAAEEERAPAGLDRLPSGTATAARLPPRRRRAAGAGPRRGDRPIRRKLGGRDEAQADRRRVERA